MGGNPAYCQDLGDGVHGGLYAVPILRAARAGMGAQGANNLNALNLAKPKIAPPLKLPPQRAAVQRGSRPCQALNVATKGKHVPQRILPEPMAAVKAPALPDLKVPPQRAAVQQRPTLPNAGKSVKKAFESPGGQITETNFLDAAIKYLGKDYKALPNGRYVSHDGMRQVRYGRHEVRGNHHAHFEAYDGPGGRVIENRLVEILKE